MEWALSLHALHAALSPTPYMCTFPFVQSFHGAWFCAELCAGVDMVPIDNLLAQAHAPLFAYCVVRALCLATG